MTLWTPPRKSLLRPKTASYAYVSAGAASTTVFFSNANLAVGDMLLMCAPYDDCIPLDFNRNTITSWGHGYNAYCGWKVLTNASDIALRANSYGAIWIAVRGPDAATLAAWGSNQSTGVADMVDVVMPAPQTDTIGYVAFSHDRSADVSTMLAPAGWTSHQSGQTSSAFTSKNWDKPTVIGAHTDQFTNFSTTSGYFQFVAEYELRKL